MILSLDVLSFLEEGVYPMAIADEGGGRAVSPVDQPMLYESRGRSSLLANEIVNSVSFLSTSGAVEQP